MGPTLALYGGCFGGGWEGCGVVVVVVLGPGFVPNEPFVGSIFFPFPWVVHAFFDPPAFFLPANAVNEVCIASGKPGTCNALWLTGGGEWGAFIALLVKTGARALRYDLLP